MHFKMYLNILFFAVISFDTHLRISGAPPAKQNDLPKTFDRNKTNSMKITTRTSSSNGVFAVRMGTDGNASQKCRCVSFHECNVENVYHPMANESNINCGTLGACCILPQDSQNSNQSPAAVPLDNTNSMSSTNTADVCVAPDRCDQNGFAAYYGFSKVLERSDFSDCPKGKLLCPVENVIPTPGGTDSSSTTASTPYAPEDCTCISSPYCNADFGENILTERMDRCDVGEICCPSDLIISLGKLPEPTVAPSSNVECGIKKSGVGPRLLGGTDAKFGEFPWMVLILERINNVEKLLCGASLISTTVVLTAAHCVYNKSMDSLIIRAGENDLSLPSTSELLPHQDRSVRNISIHINYVKKLLIHDLAFVVVDSHFNYASNVAPICLPLIKSPYSPVDPDMYDFDHCIATGWGAKSANEKSTQNTLGKIDLKLVSPDQCLATLRKSPLGPRFILHSSLICAIGVPGTDTCKGDGGGPLICPLKNNPNKYVQVGVIAGGLNCSGPYPGLYASLLHSNSDWITEEILFSHVFSKLL